MTTKTTTKRKRKRKIKIKRKMLRDKEKCQTESLGVFCRGDVSEGSGFTASLFARERSIFVFETPFACVGHVYFRLKNSLFSSGFRPVFQVARSEIS